MFRNVPHAMTQAGHHAHNMYEGSNKVHTDLKARNNIFGHKPKMAVLSVVYTAGYAGREGVGRLAFP